MSKIGSIEPNVSGRLNIEKPLHAVVLKLSLTSADLVGGLTTPDSVLELLETQNIMFSANIKEKSGNTKRLYTQMPLLPVAELQTANDNHMVASKSGNDLVVLVYLPFSETGAIPFDNDETMELSFEQSVFRIDVYSFDHKLAGGTINRVEPATITQGTREKQFDLEGMSTLLLRKSDLTASTKIILHYSNGRMIEYSNEEIDMLGLLSNEVCLNFNGAVKSGFGKYAIIDVSECTRLEITRASSSAFEFYYVKEDVHQDFQKADIQNARLKDTTRIRKINFAQKFIKA